MKIQKVISGLIFFAILCICSCTSTKKSEAGTGGPGYTETFRPQFHFSPDSMWMNDPNGMVYYEGEYHLFYQYYPYDNIWGPMHWGHAVSSDLIHWENLPIALYPDSLGAIFSGSAVLDRNNSSGLGSREHPPMVAIFTHHNQDLADAGSDLFQYQSIAYSLDRGRSWTKYPENPVLQNPGIRDFRDPKVSWYEAGQKWIMVLAAQDRIMFYSSLNLIDWNKESEFTATRAPNEGVWECPDFFPLSNGEDTKWVLLVSVGAGGPQGGSGTKYYIGDFDGSRFTSADPSGGPRWIDYGKDNYAGVTWSNVPPEDGRRIFLGWMSNWQYAQVVPTRRWRSAMTLPRELRLGRDHTGYLLRSVPVAETAELRSQGTGLDPGPVRDTLRLDVTGKGAVPLYELDLTFEYATGTGAAPEFGILLKSSLQEQLLIGYNVSGEYLYMDRSRSGITDFSDDFPGIHHASYKPAEEGRIRFHLFIDLSSVELFVDQGSLVMTDLCFPPSGYENIFLFSRSGTVTLTRGNIYGLKRIWP